MKAQYILSGIAAIYVALVARSYLRTGTIGRSQKTFLLVAAIFVVVALVLQLRQ